jgi:hypothetical protein
MLDLSHLLIFVAGAAGLAAFATLVAKFLTVVDARLPSWTGPDTLVRALVPVTAGRGGRATVRAEPCEFGKRSEVLGSKIMANDGRTWIDQQREELVRRHHELCRDLEELASSSVSVNTSKLQARRDRRERIAGELDDIETHLADLNVDERNIGSMEGRE